MTTFTMQDLTPLQQEAVKHHEAMLSAYSIVNNRSINDLSTTADQAVEAITKEEFMEHGMNNPISASAIDYATQHAPEPQPTLADIVNNICTQLQLLTSVITSSQAETKAGENSLQETVGLVLQQADWFKDLIRVELVALDLEKIAEGAVESIVENEVESYFENRFDPSDHFDFGDAVSDCVSDQIDDVVSDKIDDAVDAYLTNATISISK